VRNAAVIKAGAMYAGKKDEYVVHARTSRLIRLWHPLPCEDTAID